MPKYQDVSLSKQAYEKISELLVSGVIQPGTFRTERELSEMIGIGRQPIREALIRLANEQAIQFIPYKGVYFQNMSQNGFLQELEVRRVLEGLAACKGARLATEDERRLLREMAADMRKAGDDFDLDRVLEIDDEMNALLIKIARNPFIGVAINPLLLMGRRFYHMNFHSERAICKDIAHSHADLLETIASGNEQNALEASNRNIDVVVHLVRSSTDFDLYEMPIGN